jgi:nucleotide-binding universal stress UspA family protein
MDAFRIVVGVDLSERSDRAVDHALRHGMSRERAEVHVLHVGDPANGVAVDALTKRISTRAVATGRVRVVAHRRDGVPAEEIVELARSIDARLIFVGSHGHGGGSHLLGSVAARVSVLAPCAVWFVDTRPTDRVRGGRA